MGINFNIELLPKEYKREQRKFLIIKKKFFF